MAELVTSGFRVSVRELREESYRALRSRGYDWGQAQAASRLAAEAQVLWGSGLGAIEHECSRLLGKRRFPVSDSQGAIRNRGSSFTIWGPIAASLAISRADATTKVRGVLNSESLATAFWDFDEFSTWSWGDSVNKFAIDQMGNLISNSGTSSSKSSISINKSMGNGSDFKVLLSVDERKQKLKDSLTNGVEVDSKKWSALKKHSWKFLVPE